MDAKFNELLMDFFEGVYIVDTTRKIIFWNSGSERITGYTAKEVLNKHCFNNILRHVDSNGKELCFNGCPLHSTLATGKNSNSEVFLHHKEGHRVPVSVKSMPLKDEKGIIIGAIEVFTDLRFNKNNYVENRELKELLSTDTLTGIPNRRFLDFYLSNLVNENKQFNTSFGILFFDIDDFKKVNDIHGHNIGDEILKMVAKTLKSNVRGVDRVGRWGGEEFISIISCEKQSELKVVAEKLRILVASSSYQIDSNTNLQVTVSIGGTLYRNEEDITTTIERADKLMYQSKQEGKNKTSIE